MSLKENLLRKIEINRCARNLNAATLATGGNRKVDRSQMRFLLESAHWQPQRQRDLELFVAPADEVEPPRILVLDNELAVYRTSVEDVVLRKNPELREMVKIRNMFKILNDSDVVISRRNASLQTVHQEALDALDLSYQPDDIKKLAYEGIASLEMKDADGVHLILTLFAELLELVSPPKPLKDENHDIWASRKKDKTTYDPIILFNRQRMELKMVRYAFNTKDPEIVDVFAAVIAGDHPANHHGAAVFSILQEKVLS